MSKVSLGDGRFGFVKTGELEQGGTPAAQVPFEEVMRRYPPAIEVQPVVLSTKDATINIKGVTSDSDLVNAVRCSTRTSSRAAARSSTAPTATVRTRSGCPSTPPSPSAPA